MSSSREGFGDKLEGDVHIIRLNGRMFDRTVVERTKDDLYGVIEKVGPTRLVLDFADVGALSTAILGVIVAVHHRVRGPNGQPRMCHLLAPVREALNVTMLHHILPIDDTIEQSLAALR